MPASIQENPDGWEVAYAARLGSQRCIVRLGGIPKSVRPRLRAPSQKPLFVPCLGIVTFSKSVTTGWKMALIQSTARINCLLASRSHGIRQRLPKRFHQRPNLLQPLAMLALVGVPAAALFAFRAGRPGGPVPRLPPLDLLPLGFAGFMRPTRHVVWRCGFERMRQAYWMSRVALGRAFRMSALNRTSGPLPASWVQVRCG